MYKIYKITSHPTVDFAAEELKRYLRMMMPHSGEIVISYNPEAKDGFRLGLMQDFGIDVSEAEDLYLDDIIHIDTDECGGIIAGDNMRSVLLAVYKYLTLNGCRWLFPGVDGEFIPIQSIVPTSYHKLADNRYRGWCNEGAEFQQCMLDAIDFAPKIGLNIFMLEFFVPQVYYSWYYNHLHNENNIEPEPVSNDTVLQWKKACEAEIAKRSLQFHDIGHGWTCEPFDMREQDLFTKGFVNVPEEYRQYLAMKNGKRDLHNGNPSHTHICMSNPTARKYVVDYIADYAQNNSHIDYLNVALADGTKNQCECEECRKKTPSDWYVTLLNEADAELTRRDVKTRLVFCCYTETTWPPEVERLNNPKRFIMNLAAISRKYFETISTELPPVQITKYELNNMSLLPSVDDYIVYAQEWQKRCGMDMFAYEYHFYVNQFKAPDLLSYAKTIHSDIHGYKKHGFLGMIEDGTQRCFFPNGFNLFVYASTLFDLSSDFDALVEDYFSHAYGEDWREVKAFFEKIADVYSPAYLMGHKYIDITKGKAFNPEEADKMRKMTAVADEFAPFIKAHRNMPMRAQTVAYKLLARYSELLCGFSKPCVLKALGADEEAKEAFIEFLDKFGKYEHELKAYYDQHMFGMAFDSRFLGKLHIMNIGQN